MLRAASKNPLCHDRNFDSLFTQTLPEPNVRNCAALAALARLIAVLLSVWICTATGMAQQKFSNTDGSSPSGLEPGAPAGSYPLSGFENLNYYNGSLNVTLPILTIGGRGGAQFTVPLNVRTHPWRVSGIPIQGSNPLCFIYYADNH